MIHFIWLGPDEFRYADYLAIRTAQKVYKEVPYLWVDDTVPENEWLAKARGYSVRQLIPGDWQRFVVIGKKQSASQSSNYLRYCLLYRFGGLYLDTDTLCIKSIFDFDLQGLVVGRDDVVKRWPLCTAIMYVKKCHNPDVKVLLRRCIDILEESGGDVKWGTTGPRLLSAVLPTSDNLHTLLPKECFYFYGYPEWQELFEDNPIDERMYVLHYWGKYARDPECMGLDCITPEYIRTSNSLYAKVVRKVLGEDYL